MFHINLGRKTTSFPLFHTRLPGLHLCRVSKGVWFPPQGAPAGFWGSRGPELPVSRAALDVTNCREETSLPPHCSFPRIFVERLLLSEVSESRLPCSVPGWSSARRGTSGKTRPLSPMRPSFCRWVIPHRILGRVKRGNAEKTPLIINFYFRILIQNNFGFMAKSHRRTEHPSHPVSPTG